LNRTAAAVRALLAEVAPGRTLQLRTSDGVCDSTDPAVLVLLRELHPQAERPGLAAPFPEDLLDFTTWWATDQRRAMEAVVRSFPPGSAAGPSGPRPQHLLYCLNSCNSAAKTALLEALLTVVTTVGAGRLHPRPAPWSTHRMQKGNTLGLLLFAAGIQADLDALPPGWALHR